MYILYIGGGAVSSAGHYAAAAPACPTPGGMCFYKDRYRLTDRYIRVYTYTMYIYAYIHRWRCFSLRWMSYGCYFFPPH